MKKGHCHDVLNQFKVNQSGKGLALLIDPDKFGNTEEIQFLAKALKRIHERAIVLVGGSLVVSGNTDLAVESIRSEMNKYGIPVILFPGSPTQLTHHADAVLFISLISGRNPDLLIGRHVEASPFILSKKTEMISTGYMLIDGGAPTTANYISQTAPIPSNKPDIAVATAIAGEALGMKIIYMDTGSGAPNSVPLNMIKAVSKTVEIPVFVGGGILSAHQGRSIYDAGADWIVVGSAVEDNHEELEQFIELVESYR